jgi:methylated-DNA-[protein]-cysteine S-methyltransferase
MSFGTINTPVGDVTVCADAEAIVAVRWQAASCGVVSAVVVTALEQLEAYFAGELKEFRLPLIDAGSPFQRRVWSALREIPYGRTTTYGALAAALGTGPRALAQACARNPLPILVPCHRVVASNGALAGYSGGRGASTKAALLALEGAIGPS